MTFARVLERDRNGREILWQCSDCDKPFNLGWGSQCNACIKADERHRELVAALTPPAASVPDEPETPTEQIASSVQAPWRAFLTDWLAARAYAKEHGISPQDALCGFPFSEGYEGSTQDL